MKEHRIFFSAPMVRAILEGRKTQTRCVVKFPSDFDGTDIYDNGQFGLKYSSSKFEGCVERLRPKWEVGDRLWVRETWAMVRHSEDGQCYGDECLECAYEYRADKPEAKWAGDWDNGFVGDEVPTGCKWKPSIFMPRAASRITLEITDIRVERLRSISTLDAIAEGVGKEIIDLTGHIGNTIPETIFASLWMHINGLDSWETNPFVWVITFIRL